MPLADIQQDQIGFVAVDLAYGSVASDRADDRKAIVWYGEASLAIEPDVADDQDSES
jgi:hypothetical protein